jgi:hypothetical protein
MVLIFYFKKLSLKIKKFNQKRSDNYWGHWILVIEGVLIGMILSMILIVQVLFRFLALFVIFLLAGSTIDEVTELLLEFFYIQFNMRLPYITDLAFNFSWGDFSLIKFVSIIWLVIKFLCSITIANKFTKKLISIISRRSKDKNWIEYIDYVFETIEIYNHKVFDIF